MKIINIVWFLIILISISYAQIPEPAFHPMTAPGAKGIYYSEHILVWVNPTDVIYNEVYFSEDSALVANIDPSVKILNGNPSTVFSSVPLSIYGTLNYHTRYFWKVVEYNSFGQTAGPVWYFISRGPYLNYWEDSFDGGLSNYTMILPPGASWSISNSSYAGRFPPELLFDNSTIFNDTSYLIRNNYFDLSPLWNYFRFHYSVDWQVGEFTVGLAYSLNEGTTWIAIWQQEVTEDIPATLEMTPQIPNENYVKLALFCTSTIPNSAGYWYIDNLELGSALTLSRPPAQIYAISDSVAQKIFLSWGPGYTVNPSWGYVIQRKNGLPSSTSAYQEICWVGPNVFSFEDVTVQLDSIYTYRIQSREGPGGGFRSIWSNEATAYVPAVVPVELISFSFEIIESDVHLSWITATEINNQGFEILRTTQNDFDKWNKVGFVAGHGTTTEQQQYSFVDEILNPGIYQYRLKQIDFNGSFELSIIIEVDIRVPTEFSLKQNYPNPFNPSTTINYSIGEKGVVNLKVYDILGKEVSTLVNETQEAGNYSIKFNASQLPSGIYFYRITSGNYTATKKLLLLK